MHARAETEPDLFDDAASAPGDEAAVLALYQAARTGESQELPDEAG